MIDKKYLWAGAAALAAVGVLFLRTGNTAQSEDGAYYAGESGIDALGGVSSFASAPGGGNSYPLIPQNTLTDTGVNSGLDNYAGAESSSTDMTSIFSTLLENNKILGLANIDMNKDVALNAQSNELVQTLGEKLGVNEMEQLQFNPNGTVAGVVKRALRGPKYYDGLLQAFNNKINSVLKTMKPVETNLSKWEVERSTINAKLATETKAGAIKSLQNRLAHLDSNIAGAKTRLAGFERQIDVFNADKAAAIGNGSALEMGNYKL